MNANGKGLARRWGQKDKNRTGNEDCRRGRKGLTKHGDKKIRRTGNQTTEPEKSAVIGRRPRRGGKALIRDVVESPHCLDSLEERAEVGAVASVVVRTFVDAHNLLFKAIPAYRSRAKILCCVLVPADIYR
jgi:hypothetical protein